LTRLLPIMPQPPVTNILLIVVDLII